MRNSQLTRGALCLLLLYVVLNGGCWGRKFFKAPGETLDTSSKVDSLLGENIKLQRRVYRMEKEMGAQQDYSRNVNAQLKMDLEELKDQVNVLQQMLREMGLRYPYEIEKDSVPDTVSRGAEPGLTGLLEGARSGREIRPPPESPQDTSVVETDTAAAVTRTSGGGEQAGVLDTARAFTGVSVPSPQEIQRQVYLDFSRGNYQLALEESEVFLKNYPGHALGEDVHFIRGECFIEQGKHFDALKEFSIILKKYPHGKSIPPTLLRMAVSYESIGEEELAAGVARRLIKEYPYSEEAAAAEEQFRELLKK